MSDNDKIKKLEEQVKLLMKVVDKNQLNRHMPQQEIGTSVKVSLFRESPGDEGQLVVGWSGMKRDIVKYTNRGEFEDQKVDIYFEGYEKIQTLKNTLKLCTKPETIALKEKEIAELAEEYILELSLVDFGNFVKADIEGSMVKTTDVISGEPVAVIDFRDKEYRIPTKFLNL